jgi:hypothetical protein
MRLRFPADLKQERGRADGSHLRISLSGGRRRAGPGSAAHGKAGIAPFFRPTLDHEGIPELQHGILEHVP